MRDHAIDTVAAALGPRGGIHTVAQARWNARQEAAANEQRQLHARLYGSSETTRWQAQARRLGLVSEAALAQVTGRGAAKSRPSGSGGTLDWGGLEPLDEGSLPAEALTSTEYL